MLYFQNYIYKNQLNSKPVKLRLKSNQQNQNSLTSGLRVFLQLPPSCWLGCNKPTGLLREKPCFNSLLESG